MRRQGTTHRLLLIFAATILTPGMLLGFFGLRALIQERRLAEQQIRDRLQASAETLGRLVELEFLTWQQGLDETKHTSATDPASWPARVRRAVEEPGSSAVVLLAEGKRVWAMPPGRVLYNLSPVPNRSVARQPWPLEAEAESLELRNKDYGRAIALYRGLLASAQAPDRARILHGDRKSVV